MTVTAPHPTDRAHRVLVVDDEDNITFLLSSALRHFGFEVEVTATGRQALEAISSFAPDLVLLDVMLPDLDGFDVVRRLRSEGVTTPVLFLTARDTTEDRVRGLTLGGDDYVAKPFSLEEVVARIHAILRRQGFATRSSQLSLAGLEMDDDAHCVRRDGEPVDLSPTEYKLLRFLLVNAGKVLTRAQILDHVWEYDFGGNTNVVDTYVSYLRKKVDRVDPPLIQTIRGVGYSLRLRSQRVGRSLGADSEVRARSSGCRAERAQSERKDRMNSVAKTLAAAAMGAVGVLTLVNVASAQTTTTETPAAEAPADSSTDDSAGAAADENCPERDGAGSGSGSDSSGSTGSTGSNIGVRRL